MKKALMVLSFALCASLAFAQTDNFSRGLEKVRHEKSCVKISDQKASVNYKASIFTKDADVDTAAFHDFSDSDAGITVGTITTGDVQHLQQGAYAKWVRWADSATCAATADETYPNKGWVVKEYALYYMGAANNGSDNGFYMIVYDGGRNSGSYNSYIEFPAATKDPNASLIDIRLNQFYYKYYDKCYVDYKVGNNWKSVEINVTGIDCEVNGFAAYQVGYGMPLELAQQPSIEIRLRGESAGTSGNTYGYAWAVDNVAICNVYRQERWKLSSEHAYEGFYGQIPQGMSLPLSYALNARNTGVAPLNNAKLVLSAGDERNALSPIIEGVATNIPNGNVNTPYKMVINERGFMDVDDANLDGMNQGSYTGKDNYGTASNAGFQGRSLPVATPGKKFYNIAGVCGNMTTPFDTIAYRVTEYEDANGKVSGYRWSHDNGVIPSRSIFAYQFTDVQPDNNVYVVDNDSEYKHFIEQGYYVNVRYVSGSQVPENYVFRGLELVPATKSYIDTAMTGAKIYPIAMREKNWSVDDRYIYFASDELNIGMENQAVEVSSAMGNNDITSYGVIAPGESYNSIQIQFLDQPAIEPNTAYRFGYRMANDAMFAVASQRGNTVMRDDTNGLWWTSYSRIPEIADYQVQTRPHSWQDIMVYDKKVNEYLYGINIDEYPLIRPIIGPRQELPSVNIALHLDADYNDTTVVFVHGTDQYTHDDVFSAAVGSTQALYIYGHHDNIVLDSLYINGRKVEPYNQATEQGDENFREYDDNVTATIDGVEQVLLYKKFYYYFFDLTDRTSVSAGSTYNVQAWGHWVPIGIDPVASNVRMTLAPNPATSQVKLSLEGVNGMVNCNIIDMSGRVVYNANLNAEKQQVLDLSNIATGAYFVRVTNDKFSKIEKLIIR